MGARFLVGSLVLAPLWYLWLGAEPERSLGRALFHILVATLASAVVGKLVGIGLYQLRRARRPAWSRDT